MKFIISMLLMFISLKVSAPNLHEFPISQGRVIINPFFVLWDHVKWTETRHTDTINIHEQAYGQGQITPVKLREFNKETGKHYTLRDCMNEAISEEIFLHHCEKYSTLEYASKRWNGSGPATILYWNKVQTLPLLEYRLRLIHFTTWKPESIKLRSLQLS